MITCGVRGRSASRSSCGKLLVYLQSVWPGGMGGLYIQPLPLCHCRVLTIVPGPAMVDRLETGNG
jgi:hypothetical protein